MKKIKSWVKILIAFFLLGSILLSPIKFCLANPVIPPVIRPIGYAEIIAMIELYSIPFILTIVIEFSIIYYCSKIVIEKEDKYSFLLLITVINIITIISVQVGVFGFPLLFIIPIPIIFPSMVLLSPYFLLKVLTLEIIIIIIEFIIISYWLYQLHDSFELPKNLSTIFLWITFANIISFVLVTLLWEFLMRLAILV